MELDLHLFLFLFFIIRITSSAPIVQVYWWSMRSGQKGDHIPALWVSPVEGGVGLMQCEEKQSKSHL